MNVSEIQFIDGFVCCFDENNVEVASFPVSALFKNLGEDEEYCYEGIALDQYKSDGP